MTSATVLDSIKSELSFRSSTQIACITRLKAPTPSFPFQNEKQVFKQQKCVQIQGNNNIDTCGQQTLFEKILVHVVEKQ